MSAKFFWSLVITVMIGLSLGVGLPLLFGDNVGLILLLVCVAISYLAAKKSENLVKKARVQEWRDNHPEMTDDRLPEHLR